jgi:SAM-dependent methyltransferase
MNRHPRRLIAAALLALAGTAGAQTAPATGDAAPAVAAPAPATPNAASSNGETAPVITPVPVVEEVPFITTPDHVTMAMLEIARVGPRDRVIDLGSGDGRIVITAARRFGASGLGVEIVPDLVEQSRRNAEIAGVADRAEFRVQDLFQTDLRPYSVITMYLLQEINLQLRPALLGLAPGTRVVSHDWDMGDWLPDRTLTLDVPDKAVGREKLSRVHLWVVPAALEGLWCGDEGAQWRLSRRHQFVQGHAGNARDTLAVQGRIDGTTLYLGSPQGELWARYDATTPIPALQVVAATGVWRAWREMRFLQYSGDRCTI